MTCKPRRYHFQIRMKTNKTTNVGYSSSNRKGNSASKTWRRSRKRFNDSRKRPSLWGSLSKITKQVIIWSPRFLNSYKVPASTGEKFSLKGIVILTFCILLPVPETTTKESAATILKLRGVLPSLRLAPNRSIWIMRCRAGSPAKSPP